MQVAVPLYSQFTALDAVGPYEVLSRVPGVEVVFVGARRGPVDADVGSLALHADALYSEVVEPDVVVVPGGPGQHRAMEDERLLAWLRAVDAGTTWTTSVCTGSLLLAAAGLLAGRRATTHWLALEQLAEFGVEPTSERVVFDGKYVTAAGVSSGIDMALALVGRVAGDTVAQAVQLGIEYDPQPPYGAGSPGKAPGEVVALLESMRSMILTGA
ncbi:DJ-1/PfpI family protein [Cryptosporangium phraense]|uniref:DJ-1/PfpI family protein n=1 Tax=Cryptosporangium phraense TaxID=2593070 RepID=A0A545AFK0_9ACTN|nr:DJ-1/PfpI family protein [Cryptosporangium phraense]TQS40099.1 DJ-1/PfpI family protein [Cryptosporangium phraense]